MFKGAPWRELVVFSIQTTHMGHLTADCDDVIIITVNHSSFLVDISGLSGTGRFKVGSGHSLDLYSLDGRAQEITLPIFKQNGFSFLISFFIILLLSCHAVCLLVLPHR